MVQLRARSHLCHAPRGKLRLININKHSPKVGGGLGPRAPALLSPTLGFWSEIPGGFWPFWFKQKPWGVEEWGARELSGAVCHE